MRYKQVTVVTNYGADIITDADTFEFPHDVAGAGEFVLHNILHDLQDESLRNILGVVVEDGVAIVNRDEETVDIVIPEGHFWYNRVDEHQMFWDVTTCNAWAKLLWGSEAATV